MNKYLALDVETGGIGLNKSLLTAYLAVLDENLELIDELELYLRPDDKEYTVTASALNINKIDLPSHDKKAINYKTARGKLYNWLNKYSEEGKNKLIPVGHNVKFDVLHITDKLISRGSWEHLVSYRTLDTGPVAQFLKLLGLMPEEVSGGLESLMKYYDIKPEGDLHDAKTDTLLTVEVLKAMMKQIKGEVNGEPNRRARH